MPQLTNTLLVKKAIGFKLQKQKELIYPLSEFEKILTRIVSAKNNENR